MSLQANHSLREVLASHPQTRPVFDRYGLKGCGGKEGPAESLGFFARAHGVELENLIRELDQAIENPESLPSLQTSDPSDTIYRRFFKAGMATTLTAGALWGAWLLLTIGSRSNFTAISIFDVNAHGHAQIFGWVGLFVMGFAYQAFPRFKHTSLWRPHLAVVSFYLMIGGLILRVFSEPLHQSAAFFWLGLCGSGLEFSAIFLFVVILLKTFQQSRKPADTYDYYIGVALFWFVVQSALDLFHLYMTTLAPDRDSLLSQVATWQAPLRDVQIHGFAMTMILGVSQRFSPACWDFRQFPNAVHSLV
ncbi:MAG: NnrS family protein [Terriglobia bacterium]